MCKQANMIISAGNTFVAATPMSRIHSYAVAALALLASELKRAMNLTGSVVAHLSTRCMKTGARAVVRRGKILDAVL